MVSLVQSTEKLRESWIVGVETRSVVLCEEVTQKWLRSMSGTTMFADDTVICCKSILWLEENFEKWRVCEGSRK